MKTLPESLQADFGRDGFVMLPRFLEPSLNSRLRASVELLMEDVYTAPKKWEAEALYQSQCQPDQLAHLSGDQRKNAEAMLYIVGRLTRHLPDVKALLASRSVVAIAEAVLGEEVRLHFSNLTLRASRLGCGNAWHRDYPNQFCCGADERQLRLIICLDGMAEAQGAVRVVAGSHHWTKAQWATFKRSDEAKANGDVRTLGCPPGTVVALDCRTAHSVLPNISAEPRANIIAQYGARSNPLAVGDYELECNESESE
ncbi:MAG: hypothetical protein EA353_00365 [Puniceicoccaceae bacterium]|nr:MAG: hypothetical protein EA353_00365 [Puniceicoccaceae bacterium]